MTFPPQIKATIFTEVDPRLTPEVKSESLVKLRAIVRQKGIMDKYEPEKSQNSGAIPFTS